MISFKHIFIVPLILIIFGLPVSSEVEFPEIPPRPSLKELKESLRNKIIENMQMEKDWIPAYAGIEIKNENKKQ